jgi:SAM-dependent methyltransferase
MTTQSKLASEVAELYQEYPYPAHGVVSDVVAALVSDSVRALQRRLGRERLRVLDAGCGTGEQTLGIARRFPELEVMGIDFNRRSLEMATNLAARSGSKVRFERRNLMEPVSELGAFDLVVSIGVLHSLPSPEAGFAHLRQVVAASGCFVGMVYGEFGKWELVQVRDALAMIGHGQLPRDQRLAVLKGTRLAPNTGLAHYWQTLVRRKRFGPRIPIVEAARRVVAGRSAAYQADAFTHVKEDSYTFAALDELLRTTGWQFEGWPRQSGLPDAPEDLFDGAALDLVKTQPLLEQAAIYERLLRPLCLYFIASPRAQARV